MMVQIMPDWPYVGTVQEVRCGGRLLSLTAAFWEHK